MDKRNDIRPKRAWNYPTEPLVMLDVPREEYINVVKFLQDRGSADIFCCDKGIWLPYSATEDIQAVSERFTVSVLSGRGYQERRSWFSERRAVQNHDLVPAWWARSLPRHPRETLKSPFYLLLTTIPSWAPFCRAGG